MSLPSAFVFRQPSPLTAPAVRPSHPSHAQPTLILESQSDHPRSLR